MTLKRAGHSNSLDFPIVRMSCFHNIGIKHGANEIFMYLPNIYCHKYPYAQ